MSLLRIGSHFFAGVICLVLSLGPSFAIAEPDNEPPKHAPKTKPSPSPSADERAAPDSQSDSRESLDTSEEEKQKKEEEDQDAAAIESLELKGKSAEEVAGLLKATQQAFEDLEGSSRSAKEASETGLSNEEVSKLLPLFRQISDKLSREQLAAVGNNEALLAALNLNGNEKQNARNLFLRTAQGKALSLFADEVVREAKFAAIAIGSTQLGRNTREGLCAGIECARDRIASANQLTPGAKSPAEAARQRDEMGSFPANLLVDGKQIPTVSNQGVMELSRVYHGPENDRSWNELMDYSDRAGIKPNDIEKHLTVKSEAQLRTDAAQSASYGSGYPLWVSAEFPVRDGEGKPVLQPNGEPKTKREGHVVTVFSLGVGDNRQLIVRDPNFPDIGTAVQVKDGVFSYSYKPPGDAPPFTESWDRFVPDSLYWPRVKRKRR